MRPSPGLARAQRRWMLPAEQWRQTRTEDGVGGFEVAWTLVASIVAVVSPPSFAERETAQQSGVELTHTAKVPLTSTVRRDDRIVQGGATYSVGATLAGTHDAVKVVACTVEPWDEPTAA